MKITEDMINRADSVLSRSRPGIPDDLIRLALEAAFASPAGDIVTNTCPKCNAGGTVVWFSHNKITSTVQQNRLNTSDVECLFVQGCEACGETLKTLRPYHIVEMLAATPYAWHWRGPKGGFIADTKKPEWPSEPLYATPVVSFSRSAADAVAVLAALERPDIKAFEQSLKVLNDTVDAWEALPGGRQVRNSDVERWMAVNMAPAINAIRKFLKREKPTT